MTILKFILYTVLTFCSLWIFLIFAGSAIIKISADRYFENRFSSKSIIVSPNLDVNLTRVDLEFQNFEISAKKVAFEWSIFNNEPYLKLILGPTRIADFGAFDGATITISSDSLFLWGGATARIRFEDFSVNENFTFDSFEANAIVSQSWNALENIVFEMIGFSYFNKILAKVDQINGTIDQLDLTKPTARQNNIGTLRATNVNSSEPRFQIDEVFANIDSKLGQAEVFADLNELEIFGGELVVNNIGVTALISLEALESTSPIKIAVKSARQVATGLHFQNLVSQISFENGVYFADGSVTFEKSELKFGSQVYGIMPENIFFTKFTVKKDGEKIDLNAHFSSEISVEPNLDLEGTLTVEEFPILNNFDCNTSNCDVGKLNFEYELGTDSGASNGSVKCSSLPCRSDNMFGDFYFVNTVEFFRNVAETKIFNPLVLAYVYTQVLAGKKNGKDHSLKLSNY